MDRTAATLWAVPLLLAALTVLASHLAPRWVFIGLGLGLLIAICVVTYRFPSAALALLLLGPLIDHTLLDRIVPSDMAPVSTAFGELLLVVIAPAILLRALHEGRARSALQGWPIVLLLAFVAFAIMSALANSVPPMVALLGIAVTIDAIALFFLAPLAGVELRSGNRLLWLFAAVIGITSTISVAQAIFGASALGLSTTAGRLGEGLRLSSLVGDPNAFGVLIGMIVTLPLAEAAYSSGWRRWLAGLCTLILAIALLFTYSRGAWFGTTAGIMAASLITGRLRLLSYGAGIAIVALVLATIAPRNVLGVATPSVATAPSPTPAESQLVSATSAPSATQTPAPTKSNGPSGDFLRSAIDRVLRVVSGSDLRTKLVINGAPILAQHPLLGVGPGRYGGAVSAWYPTPVYPAYGTDKLLTYQIGYKKFFHQQTVDNFWLHLAVESGILGILAFAGLILVPLVRISRASRAAYEDGIVLTAVIAVAAVGVLCSATTMLLEANASAFPFWLLLGIGWSIVRSREVQVA